MFYSLLCIEGFIDYRIPSVRSAASEARTPKINGQARSAQ